MSNKGPKRVCEYCLKSRLESSFKPAPPGWEHSNPIGPWCKFCDQEFRFETSAPGDLAASLAAIMDPQVDYHEWILARLEDANERTRQRAQEAYVNNRRSKMQAALRASMDSWWDLPEDEFTARHEAFRAEYIRLNGLSAEQVMAEWADFSRAAA